MRANKTLSFFGHCLWYLIGAFLLGSCKCSTVEPTPYNAIISYQNSKGQDMFEPATPFHYNKDSITWRPSVVNLEEKLSVFKDDVKGVYVIYGSYSKGAKILQRIIKLNKTTYDTLTLSGDDVLHKVVYNSKIIPPPSGRNDYPQSFYFTVIK